MQTVPQYFSTQQPWQSPWGDRAPSCSASVAQHILPLEMSYPVKCPTPLIPFSASLACMNLGGIHWGEAKNNPVCTLFSLMQHQVPKRVSPAGGC